jgi:diguanylate cyclase (GGDEF)-like protein/PAS domain S-box-containing protein
MSLLDLRTVVFSTLATHVLCAVLLVLLWTQNRRRFKGTGFWALNAILSSLGLLLIFTRGISPDWISIVLANCLIVAGGLCGVIGLQRFVERRGSHVLVTSVFVVFALIHTYFTFVDSSLSVRTLNLSVTLLLVALQCAWLMLHAVDAPTRLITRGVGWVFALFAVVYVVRIVEFFFGAHLQGEYLRTGLFEEMVLVAQQLLFVLLTYSLSLMVNKDLLRGIKAQEAKFATAFREAPYAMVLTRFSDGRVLEVNKGFLEFTGYSQAEVLGQTSVMLSLWERSDDRAAIIHELSLGGTVEGRELEFRTKDGEVRFGRYSAEMIEVDGQKCVLSSVDDVTARKRIEDRIRHMAQHDPLTGLPNRTLFADLMGSALSAAARDWTSLAVMLADLDQFKDINDNLGHEVGDSVLRECAMRIRAAVRESDTVARIGGDEFVVLLRNVHRSEDALAVADKIRQTIREPFPVDGETIRLSVSIGIAIFPEHGTNEIELSRHADEAMYQAKDSGRDAVRLYVGLGPGS